MQANKKLGKVWSGVLFNHVLLETDYPDGQPKIIGFPRGERVRLQPDSEFPSFTRQEDMDELVALLEAIQRKG